MKEQHNFDQLEHMQIKKLSPVRLRIVKWQVQLILMIQLS